MVTQNNVSNKKLTILNICFSLLLEIVVLVHGLIVPRLILRTFGSEINGLVSSITQFLSLITIIEGGVGGVVKAALYKPLANNDSQKLSAVFNAANSFYKRLGIIYIIYGLIVAVVYPFVFKVPFDWFFVFSLVVVIALQTFIQYFFSLSLRTLIIADRKGFIVSIVSIAIQLISLLMAFLVINLFPNVLVLKGSSIILFVLQPIIYSLYVKKHYALNRCEPKDRESLKQRWDGFSHNLAFFIHSNTDIVLLTIFCTLSDVSIYSVYFLAVNALKTLVSSISSSIAPTMGNVLAKGDFEAKNKAFNIYSFVTNTISTFCFSCGIVLVTPFVLLYTQNVTDTNYFRPLLGYLLMIAEYVYCIRGPYVETAYSCGHFKQTSVHAYVEAATNIVLSIVLLFFFGIEGVALATLVAMLYRTIAHVIYLKKNILFRKISTSLISFLPQVLTIVLTFVVMYFIKIDISTYFDWIIYATITAGITISFLSIFILVFERRMAFTTLRYVFQKKRTEV